METSVTVAVVIGNDAALAAANVAEASQNPVKQEQPRQSLQNRYRDFRQMIERENLALEQEIETAIAEAKQSFDEFDKASQQNFDRAVKSLTDWATGVKRQVEDASDQFDVNLKRELADSQRSLEDLSKQFDAYTRELDRGARNLPQDIREQLQRDSLAVERSIDKASIALDQLVTDAKRSVEDASAKMDVQLKQDLKAVDRAFEDASKAVKEFFKA
jgi:hypothetical protein